MKNFKKPSYMAPFCRQPWKLPAAILLFLFFVTLAWSFHLLRDHRDMLDRDMPGYGFLDGMLSDRPVAQGMSVALTAASNAGPNVSSVRAAMVNIAGLTKSPPAGDAASSYVTAGSGVIINPKGYVVTAMHLIQDLADIHVRVQTPSGPRQYAAKMVKVVPTHDLALVKIISQDVFPYLAVDNTTTLHTGEQVQAWGDPLGTEAIQRSGVLETMDLMAPVLVRDLSLTHLQQTNAVFHWAQRGGPLI